VECDLSLSHEIYPPAWRTLPKNTWFSFLLFFRFSIFSRRGKRECRHLSPKKEEEGGHLAGHAQNNDVNHELTNDRFSRMAKMNRVKLKRHFVLSGSGESMGPNQCTR
jgi:hypothetical protein